eukprot:6093786-Pyramimonas_sp.AAC.1
MPLIVLWGHCGWHPPAEVLAETDTIIMISHALITACDVLWPPPTTLNSLPGWGPEYSLDRVS